MNVSEKAQRYAYYIILIFYFFLKKLFISSELVNHGATFNLDR